MTTKNLFDNEDTIITRMGKGFLGERAVYRGKDLHHDLKDKSWMELYVLGITGKLPTTNELKVLNFIWVSTSYPDKSIWPNHITALAATGRSTASLGLSIGMCVSEATIYGGTAFVNGIDFFIRAGQAIDGGMTLETFIDEELTRTKIIFGYGRPLASVDERVPHLIQFARDNGMGEGKHLNIALQTAKILKKNKGLCTNVSAIYNSLGADLGFTKEQFHLFMTPVFFAGTTPCFVEAQENKAGTFLPIRCDRIEYSGKKNRQW